MKGWGLGLIAGLAFALPAMALSTELNSGFDLRVFGGGNYNGGEDLETDFNVPASSDLATYFGAGADYGFQSGFVVGLDLMGGPMRRETIGGGAYPFAGVVSVQNLGAFITPGWRVSPAPDVVVEARLGLGLIEATETLELDGIGSDTYSGMGYGVWPEIRAEYEMGPWGLGLSVGYLASLVDSVADSSGQILVGYNSDNATLHTEGVSAALFAVYHFTPVLR